MGNGGTILKTPNGGENWGSQNSGTSRWLKSTYFIDSQTGWAVGWFGTILNTIDGGESWGSQSSNTLNDLESVYFTDNQIGWTVGEYETILKTTDGGSIVSVEYEQNSNQTNTFLLSQNFPNPFNPTTTIGYQLPERNLVTLKVYDILGREVATLVNEEKPVGSYEVQFIGNELTSGIYFYQLKAGDYTETKKMLMIK